MSKVLLLVTLLGEMRTTYIFTGVWVVLFLYAYQANADTLTGRTVRITDGDTIVVLAPGNVQHKIRLQGIDAPERGQAFGTKSTQHLSELVAGQEVIIEYDKRDRYGRIVGKVLVDGEDANLRQVSSGMAWHYKYYQMEQSPEDRKLYAKAEQDAREAEIGLWIDPHAIAPWDYRRSQRE